MIRTKVADKTKTHVNFGNFSWKSFLLMK